MYEKSYFSTGDLVKILGTTKNTLFHYDKIGLFCPAVVRENGYRAYSYRQLERFFAIAYLRKTGMPLGEIQQYMEGRTPQRLKALLQTQLQQVQKKLDELTQIQCFLQDHLHHLEKFQGADLERITVEHLPERLLYCSPEIGMDCDAHGLIAAGNFFAEVVTKGQGAIQPVERIRAGVYDHPRCFFTPAEEPMQGIGHMEHKPEGTFLVGYEKGTDLQEGYRRMLQYAEECGFEISGEGYEEYIVSELDTANSDEYVTRISLPVQTPRG